MKFGPVPLQDAEGCLLAHRTRLAGKVLTKGHVLSAEDCRLLAARGETSVIAARLDPDDINEDAAATRLGRAAMGDGLEADTAFTGRLNLYASTPGLLCLDEDAVTAANRIDTAITFATLANHTKVAPGRMVATAKIISFAVTSTALHQAETALQKAVRIAPFHARKVGLVATELPHLKHSTMDKTRRVLEDRLLASNSHVFQEERVAHTSEAVSAAMGRLIRNGADCLILFGASAVVDRHDILPAAIDLAGGTVAHLGMPVDPGNLLMLAELNGVPVLGAPGCARSPKENGFDWVLDRLLAGIETGPDDITAMGVGGLLMEIGTRPQPRELKRPGASPPKIAAIVLAAGQSTRMGGPNKLLAELDGKPLIRHVAETACGAALAQTILVSGHLAEEVEAHVADLGILCVRNPDFADGMAGSIATGMKAIAPDTEAVLILLGDMPRIQASDLTALISAYRASRSNLIVTATADGKRGNPVLWDRRFFDALRSLSGDVGARHVIAGNPGFVAEVEIGPAARLDLDTPQALEAAGGRFKDPDSPDQLTEGATDV